MNFKKNNKSILPVLYLIVFIIFVNKLDYCQGFHTEHLEYFWKLIKSKNIKEINCCKNYKPSDSVLIVSSLRYNKEKNILILKSYLDHDSSEIFFSTNNKLKKVILHTENTNSLLQFNYDSTKNVEAQTDYDRVTYIDSLIKYEDGRTKTITNKGRQNNTELKNKYFYNRNGEIIKIKYPFSSELEINFNYSPDGFLTSEVWTIGNDNNFCYSFTYEYLF